MHISSQIVLAVLFSLSVTSVACVPTGTRYLNVKIELDGNVVFEGGKGVPDNTPVSDMWSALSDMSFRASGEQGAEAADQQPAASLNGQVTVRIQHVDNVLATASMNELTLSSSDTGTSWQLSESEVDRIKSARVEK